MSKSRLEHPDSETTGHLITDDVLARSPKREEEEGEREEEEAEDEQEEGDHEEEEEGYYLSHKSFTNSFLHIGA